MLSDLIEVPNLRPKAPSGLSMKTRSTECGPCPTHTTSTNSRPKVQRIGDIASMIRSTTGRDSFTDTPSPVSLAALFTRSNKKVGLGPLSEEEPYHVTHAKARGTTSQFAQQTALPGAE